MCTYIYIYKLTCTLYYVYNNVYTTLNSNNNIIVTKIIKYTDNGSNSTPSHNILQVMSKRPSQLEIGPWLSAY